MYALLLALAPAPADAPFAAAGAGDDRPAGKLVGLAPDLTATLATPKGQVEVADVISLRRVGRALPPFPTGPHLVTAAGDRVAGEVRGGNAQSLRFHPAAAGPGADDAWAVPLSAVAAVWLTDTPADTPPDPANYPWAEGNKNRDLLRSRTGDTTRGVLLGLGAEDGRPTVRFRPDGGDPRTVPAGDVAAVAFNPLLAKTRRPKGPFVRVALADGSRLSLSNPSVAAGLLRGETLFGRKAEFPLAAVVALDVWQGKAAYLSDLKPAKAEQRGFVGAGWPWAADRTVHGTPLRLPPPAAAADDSTFEKGLGTHPRTVLTYDLGGRYSRFEALVGLDPEFGDRGRAVVRVLVDGKEQDVPKLKALAAGPPVPVRVPLGGAKELRLEVDFGPTGGVRAAVNWADARLVEGK